MARDDVVVVTRNGRPVAAIQGIDDDDIEDLLLERSARFWEMIAQARQGRTLSLARARRSIEAATPRRPRAAQRPKRRRQREGNEGAKRLRR